MPDTIVAAVVPPVVAFLLVKIGEIGAEQRISKAYQHATEELAFWRLFIETQSLVCSPTDMDQVKASTRQELDAVRSRIAAARTFGPVEIPKSRLRQLLLLYPAVQSRGWFARVVFYCLVIYGVLLSYELLADRSVRGWYVFPIAATVVLVIFVMALWSRGIAVRADKSKVG